MGRRKIEIRAIKDDRNRSVTFLKRKGGLFKKAHELSVLCSVDVAVIIFGHNKKLYEFSSGDINETLRRYQYYGPPHEHKGPGDFRNKGGDDDDEEEEDEEASIQNDDPSLPPQHPLMAQHLQHNNFQHIRGPGSSASPPLPNGLFQPRTGTPGPSSIGSRPSSRNTVRRPSSNLIPMQHPHVTPPQTQNGFSYAPNPPIYTPQPSVVVAPPHPSPQPAQFQQFQQRSHTPQPLHQPLPQSHSPYIPEPQHTPPVPQRHDSLQPPPQPIPRTSPQPPQQEFRQPEQATPPQIKALSSKSRSIYTPIDDGGSILAQQFFGAPDPPRRELRPDSPPQRKAPLRTGTGPPSSKPAPPAPPRPSKSSPFKPPARSDTGGSKSGAARPKLNLTIPSESSDNEESASPQARSALNSANPAREHHGIVLPPPSPSASAVLSAGASGPPNPFARPPPPTSNQNNAFSENRNNNNNNLETPISALPSRYMDRELLASPGGIFGSSWDNFNSNILPSPNIATPAEARIPGGAWGRTDAETEKRKADDLISGEGKRLKT